jgi:hypothetical protein
MSCSAVTATGGILVLFVIYFVTKLSPMNPVHVKCANSAECTVVGQLFAFAVRELGIVYCVRCSLCSYLLQNSFIQ